MAKQKSHCPHIRNVIKPAVQFALFRPKPYSGASFVGLPECSKTPYLVQPENRLNLRLENYVQYFSCNSRRSLLASDLLAELFHMGLFVST